MLRQYLKSFFRHAKANKLYYLINILGLSVGLGAGFIVLTYVMDELSYDKYNRNYDKVVRLTTEVKRLKKFQAAAPLSFYDALKQNFPQLSGVTRVSASKARINFNNEKKLIRNFVYADPDVFNIMDVSFAAGGKFNFGASDDWIVISAKTAGELFGNKNPIGSVLDIPAPGKTARLKIVGVMNDIPHNSTFRADCIAPIQLYIENGKNNSDSPNYNFCGSWGIYGCMYYLQLKDNADREALAYSINKAAIEKYKQPEQFEIRLQKLSDAYLKSAGFLYYRLPAGNMKDIYIFSSIAALLILMACINYILLSTAVSIKQAKEIAIRKVNGASRFDIIKQVMLQSVFTSIIALPVALYIVELALSPFGNLIDKKMSSELFHSAGYISVFVLITVLVGVLSGSYISFYLSKLKALLIINKKNSLASKKYYFRQAMIGLQMFVFSCLIFLSFTIKEQIDFCKTADHGFNKNGIIIMPTNKRQAAQRNSFIAEIKSNPLVENVSCALDIPFTGGYARMFEKFGPDKKDEALTEGLFVTYNFIETMKLKLIEGRSFSEAYPSDSADAVVINQTAAKRLGPGSAIGKYIGKKQVIGVVADFHTQSYREEVLPVIIQLESNLDYLENILIRVDINRQKEALDFIKAKWGQYYKTEFRYDFFDGLIDDLYSKEAKFNKLINYSMYIAIFISMLGLFGLSLFLAEGKLKDTSIRKIFGASVFDILKLQLKEYFKIAVIASLISFPAAFLAADEWLKNFAYKITPSADLFAATFILTCFITVTAVGLQCIKVARSNQISLLNSQ
jgi:putative ABC transport system permease protein